MRIASAVGMVVVGAILAFALNVSTPYIDLRLVGFILMGAGIFMGLWILVASTRGRVTETRTSYDPNTASETSRYEERGEL